MPTLVVPVLIVMGDRDWKGVMLHKDDWFVEVNGQLCISVDEACLKRDPRDDSFFVFPVMGNITTGDIGQ